MNPRRALGAVAVLVAAAASGLSWQATRPVPAAEGSSYRVPASEPCTAQQYADNGGRALFGSEPSTSTRRRTLAALQLPTGAWPDYYLGTSYRDAALLDVDHLVSLADAWVSGACHWPRPQRVQFGRDPANLVLTLARVNRSKGDDTADRWAERWPVVARNMGAPLPSASAVCDFLRRVTEVRDHWQLTGRPTPRASCHGG